MKKNEGRKVGAWSEGMQSEQKMGGKSKGNTGTQDLRQGNAQRVSGTAVRPAGVTIGLCYTC